MIKYTKRIFFLKIQESWFDGKLNFWDLFSFKVIYALKTKKRIWGIKEISHTIELDLEKSKEAIYSNFSKSNRQQIRKSEEEGVLIERSSDIKEFVGFFNDFAAKKGTYATSMERILEKKEFLILCFAKFDNNIIAAQSYLLDKDQKIIRHYQTASKRFEDNLNKNFVAHANKYLLVSNIMQFKEEGYKIFDFGGYTANTTDESLLGINNYKLKFGGEIVESKNYYSVPYWMLKNIGMLVGWKGNV